jgi:hypothetical protein
MTSTEVEDLLRRLAPQVLGAVVRYLPPSGTAERSVGLEKGNN